MKDFYDFTNGTQGPIMKVPEGKEKISIRLDQDILAWFRAKVNAAGGGNYQTLMNAALREYIQGQSPKLEDTLRKVIREELKLTPSPNGGVLAATHGGT
jgi:hypothetical protein